MTARRRGDRGEATAQLVVVLPVLLLLTWMAVQAAVYFHAANVAMAAAAQGAAAAAPRDATARDAQERAASAVAEMDAALDAVSVAATADEVAVAVTVRVPRIVPMFPTSVRREVVEPREDYVAEDRR